MKKAKRWLALILAVTLVSSNALYQIGTTLSADETQETAADESEEMNEPEEELPDVEDTEAAEVSEVTADDPVQTETTKGTGDATDETAADTTTETATEAAATGTTATEPAKETVADSTASETVTEVTGTDTAEDKTKSEEAAGTTEETADTTDTATENQDAAAQDTIVPAEKTEEEETPEETTYNVKIKVDNTEAGTIYAENADGDKEKIALEDNQYTTTVKEGEAFSFDVAVEDGYLLTEVQDQDGNTVASANADTENHTYTYEIKDIQADQTLEIAYAEVEDEITYPAFSYKGSEDDVTVNISAPEGVFPEGTEVELKALAEEDRAAIAEAGGCEPEEVVGLDITFTYEGTVIEPTGSVQVTFQADQLADEKYDEVKVFHVEKSGDVNEVEGTTDGDSVGFTADSFSPYGVTSNASEADISLTAETYDCELTVGDSTTLTIDKNNQKQDGRWKSSDTSIVSISNDSKQSVKITGAKSGEATITYYYYKKGQEKTVKTFTVKVNAAQPVITFDLNGGTGTTPASITGEEGDVITLPASTGISRENYEFIGWSINSDANKVYADIGQYPIYEAGSTYELTKSLTMYAVWAQNNGTENVKLTIAIRDDGTVPGEPSLQYAEYMYLLQTKTVNILQYVKPAKTTAGVENVKVLLQEDFYTLVNNVNSKQSYWNNDTQYVEWYVIKYQANDSTYHIDGVIRNRDKVHLNYNGNGYTEGLVPDSKEYYSGQEVEVSAAGNYYDTKDWRELKRAGYVFDSWNTEPDGTGTKYSPGDKITITKDVTLYAQWATKSYTVKYDSQGGSTIENKIVKYADTIDLNPVPTRDGYTFVGWKFNDQILISAVTYAGLAGSEDVREITLVAVWKEKTCTAGYNLVIPGATWKDGLPSYLTENGITAGGATKYIYNWKFEKGDTFTVTDAEPQVDNYVFVGWFDKKGNNKKGIAYQTKDTVTHSGSSEHTLDALWVGIEASGVEKTYDGNGCSISAKAAFNKGSLDESYVEQIQSQNLVQFGTMTYESSTDGGKTWKSEGTNNPSFTDVGEYLVKATMSVTVGGQPKLITATANVVITKRAIEITAGSASKTYDGTALTKNSYDVTDGSVATTDEITSVTVTGSITEVGTADNTASKAVIKRDGVDATGNYDITYEKGTLEITEQTIDPGTDPENPDPEYGGVTVNDPSNFEYNTNEHKFVPVVTTEGGATLTEVTDYSVVYKRNGKVRTDFTNVGEITVEITGKGNYKGTVTKTYQITPATVIITADNKTKTYGTADPELTVQKSGLFGDDDVAYTISREKSGTAEGEKVGTYDITPIGEESQGNYTVQYKSGTLTIAASGDLVVSGTNYEGTYDAQPHGSAATASVTEGTTISYKVGEDGEWTTEVPTITDVGTVDVTVQAVNPNYTTAEATYTLTVNPKEVTVKAESKTKVYGETDPEFTATTEGTLNEDTVEYTLSRVQGEDVGNYDITPKGEVAQGNYTVTYKKSTLTITCRSLTVKTESASRVYNGRALTAGGTITGLVEGETVVFNTTGTITYVGEVKNGYDIQWNGTAKQKNYTISSEDIGTLKITDGTDKDLIDPLVVKKTHSEKPDRSNFTVGDKITFNISAKNIYNENKTITLKEQEGVTITGQSRFENVEPGETVTTEATYKVQESDLVAGEFTNTVTVKFSGVTKTFKATDTVNNLDEPKAHVTITKTADNKVYKLNDEIVYTITVKNDGNMTLEKVKVQDPLTNETFEITGEFTPEAEKIFTTKPYKVTADDIVNGVVKNTATLDNGATTVIPNGPKPEGTEGEKDVPTEQQKPSLSVIKEVTYDGSEIGVGTELHYTIRVTNNGNVKISDIELNDKLLGKSWTIGTLTPGGSVEKDGTYIVTEADVVKGEVENTATATGTDPSGKNITGTGTKIVETEDANSHITIEKSTTSTPANGTAYVLGETIKYEIKVTNDGNLTLKNVIVTDELTGDEWTIDKLAPNETKTYDAEYTVKESDLGRTVMNEATARGETEVPDGPKPDVDPGRKEDKTEDRNPHLTMAKEILNKKDVYSIGDTIQYLITVTNDGNLTQSSMEISDQIKAAGDVTITGTSVQNASINGSKVTLASLAPGESAEIYAEYTVQKADRGTTITNGAAAQGTVPDPDDPTKPDPEKPDPTVVPDVPAEVEDVYDIHVVHQFAPGNEGEVTLPADYTIENVKAGNFRLIEAEAVSGYTARPTGQNVKVVDQDVTVTILYYKDSIGIDPLNPNKPDGIPDEYQAVVRFEAENGTVSIDYAVVTLYDADGNPSANGIGHLSPFDIAAARANKGYSQKSLTWSPEAPTTEYEITGDMTFKAVFTRNQHSGGGSSDNDDNPTNPTNPVNPSTPAAPVNPAANVPASQANANPITSFVDNVVTPVIETVKDRAADIQEILNEEDEEVPLADQKVDDHKCCILHFLIMLLALLISIFETRSMKKRQKKLQEVREELDCELARRGLPVTSEQQ